MSRPATRQALLIIDMISTWDFPDGDKLLPQARRIAPAIERLKQHCIDDDWPIIYANDNQGRWRSDFRQLVELARHPEAAGHDITERLAPGGDDYFVLKPKHSAFYGTPLELLLQQLDVQQLVLAGVSSDQCITVTAAEARMREYEVRVPRDCIASQTETRNDAAILHFDKTMGIDVSPAA